MLATSNQTGTHHHITRNDRIALGTLLREGYTQSEVADVLGVHRSTISRELKRNAKENGGYHALHATVLAKNRRKESKKNSRLLENDSKLSDTVEALMDPLISPECIAQLLDIHHQSIYAWIYRSRPDLRDRLPYQGKKRRRYGGKREEKQGWTKNVRTIHEREEEGISWEGDSVQGKGKTNLITHIERTSLYLDARKVPDGTADSVHATLKKNPLPGTITFDRGSEFALWRMIEEDTKSTIYFADAHAPWQRGKNENTNGRLRRPYPKRFNFDTLSDKELQATVDLMNHTPRKSLGWRMPVEVFRELCCVST